MGAGTQPPAYTQQRDWGVSSSQGIANPQPAGIPNTIMTGGALDKTPKPAPAPAVAPLATPQPAWQAVAPAPPPPPRPQYTYTPAGALPPMSERHAQEQRDALIRAMFDFYRHDS